MDFFTHATALTGLAVLAIQQVLKFLPNSMVNFPNEYPVLTNIALSIGAAIYVNWKDIITPHVWTDWAGLIATISVVAALAYNMTLRNSVAVKELEAR